MKLNDKKNIHIVLERIESGNFDQMDIENIFMKLRAYNKGYKNFKEISDLVAHNKERDRGIINENLEHRYLALLFISQYHYLEKKPLKITSPFPSWILTLIKYQVNLFDNSYFLSNYKFSKKTFLKKIGAFFKINKESGTAVYDLEEISDEFLNAIKKCLSIVSTTTSFSNEDIINDFIGVLKSNNLTFNEREIKKQSQKIMACILLLLHKTIYVVDSKKVGRSLISKENGFLILNGIIEIIIPDHHPITLNSPLILTNLLSKEWISDELNKSTQESDQSQAIGIEYDLELNSEWKFSIIT